MIGYTTIGAKDIGKALAFYDTLLAELGGKRVMEITNGQLYGFAQGPLFGVTKPHDGKAAALRQRQHDRAAVRIEGKGRRLLRQGDLAGRDG